MKKIFTIIAMVCAFNAQCQTVTWKSVTDLVKKTHDSTTRETKAAILAQYKTDTANFNKQIRSLKAANDSLHARITYMDSLGFLGINATMAIGAGKLGVSPDILQQLQLFKEFMDRFKPVTSLQAIQQ